MKKILGAKLIIIPYYSKTGNHLTKKKIPKFIHNCVRCGQYCSKNKGVPIYFDDISRWRENGTLTSISKYIGMDMSNGFPKLILEPNENEQGCPVYDSENKNCQIFHDMPLNCQAYPLGYNGEKYFITDQKCQGLGKGDVSLGKLKIQKKASKDAFNAKKESETVVPLMYSIIMGNLVEQSKKAMENMSEEQKEQIDNIVKENE